MVGIIKDLKSNKESKEISTQTEVQIPNKSWVMSELETFKKNLYKFKSNIASSRQSM